MNKKPRRTGLLLLTLPLAACTMAPDYQRPPLPVAPVYPPHEAKATAVHGATPDWQDFYRDERQRRLIALALDNNRDLRLAALNAERLQAQYRVRRAELLPTLNAGIEQSRIRPETTEDLATYGVTVTEYELDLFGRVHSLKDAALADYFSSVATRQAAQISLIAAVATADLTLRADDQLLQLARDTLQAQQKTTALAQQRVNEGLDSESTYHQHAVALQDAATNVAQLERQQAQDLHTLLFLVGVPQLPADLPAGAGAQFASINTLPAVPVGLPADLLTRRPDIIAAEQKLIGANANIGAARAAFFPRIALTGSYGQASSNLSDLFNHSTLGWSFSPKLTLPLFDFGANSANLEAAKTERKMAVAEYEKTIQTAFREVADALSAETTWRNELAAARAKAQALGRSAELAEQRYRDGSDNMLAQLNARSTWLDAQQAWVQANLHQQLNLISLYKSLGGGWDKQAVPAQILPPTQG
ncbi:efflux transporter outer membrane subunit [Gibbsiella quercinecans]|uniref:efflux transporter outer membrane subunit n=1 Tax=Gibbsiella quercinecans TaxID=929813 RepID=UPI0024314E77|nr:efflux transporter outer membrane subunit [Gibbsiella quercinecans]